MRWIRPSDFRSRKAFLHAIQSEQADIVQTEKHQVGGRFLSHPLETTTTHHIDRLYLAVEQRRPGPEPAEGQDVELVRLSGVLAVSCVRFSLELDDCVADLDLIDAANGSAWTSGSSAITLGLSPLSAWLALAFAHLFITILIVLK